MKKRDTWGDTLLSVLAWIILLVFVKVVGDWLFDLLNVPPFTSLDSAWFSGAVVGMILAKGVWDE